jgi:predicted alpha/beta superfamily hydrolase/DNA-binding LytR/AlgR family response regulator
MNIIIIEDEPLTAKDLEVCIRGAEPDATIVAVLGSVAEAVEYFRENALPDLIFSDIQLGDGLSFPVFAGLEAPVPVIFCTAYDAYALDAFRAMGIDYILKPFSSSEIAAALGKYKVLRGSGASSAGSASGVLADLAVLFGGQGARRSVLVYHKDKIIPVNVGDIAVCYLKDDVVRLVTFAKQQYTVNKTLEEIEKAVGAGFYRVNRQCLVNREAIRDVQQDLGRRLLVNLLVPCEETVTVGRAKVTSFLEWLSGRLLLFFSFLLMVLFSKAQQNDSSRLVVADVVTLHSDVLKQDRKIEIYTPALSNWDKFPGQALPVLYLLDGDALTGVVASELNYLSTSYYLLPPMIVVGISNYDHDRLHDLTPSVPDSGFGGATGMAAFGGADAFVEFLSAELIPYIEKHYKTEPFRILAGHSMGGLLSVHCLLNHSSLFNAYFAISPSLWWDNFKIVGSAGPRLDTGSFTNKFLFFSDANEGLNMHAGVESFDSVLTRKHVNGLSYQYIRYPDESHGSEPVKAIYDALKWLYPNWYPEMGDSTAFMVDKHFKSLSARYGYTILPPEWFVSKRGARILNSGRIDDAIAFFQLNIKNYPASIESLVLLGDAYLKKGDKEKALDCYTRASRMTWDNSKIRAKINALMK